MRITVFSVSACPHCARVKQLLMEKAWDFVEIDLNDYPEKRNDMLRLANKLTVPQIFFNDTHLGGATQVAELDAKGLLDALYQKCEGQVEPTNPLLSVPDYPPKEEKKIPERKKEEYQIGHRTFGSIFELNNHLESHLDIKDRSFRFRRYSKCFVGSAMVNWFVLEYGFTREQAVKQGQQLLEMKVFSHVTKDHEFQDSYLFYRLQCHAIYASKLQVLNIYRIWNDRLGSPIATLNTCRKCLFKIADKYRDIEDGKVDYLAARLDPEFTKFEEMVCELQEIKFQEMDEEERLAFGINLYNMMIIHGNMRVGAPQSGSQRRSFFENIAYKIGGLTFSFHHLEHGVLRSNRTPPYSFARPFTKSDPRIECKMSDCDARVHFALNCGAKSCPPIKRFTADAVREELRVVSMSFLEQDDNCRVDLAKGVLYLNKILGWYRSDFGSNSKAVVDRILPWSRGTKKEELEKLRARNFKIKYFSYDWTNDGKVVMGGGRKSVVASMRRASTTLPKIIRAKSKSKHIRQRSNSDYLQKPSSKSQYDSVDHRIMEISAQNDSVEEAKERVEEKKESACV